MSQDLIDQLLEKLESKKMMLVTAESCTGGFLSTLITRKPGSSKVFDRGYVTYSNEAKTECLGVPANTINTFGAVSDQVAEIMARGALKNSKADLAVSITGIAGPGGGTEEKPVGLVHFGYALKNGSVGSIKETFQGNRQEIQTLAATTAVKHLLSILSD